MVPPPFWNKPLVAVDTSAVINLNATDRAPEIVEALESRIVAVDVVQAELEAGRRNGRRDADLFHKLVAEGMVDVVALDDAAAVHFEGLVIGPAAATLDDGEAATIAYALARDAAAVIDERKATNICAQRFPALTVSSTVDLLAQPQVRLKLGDEGLAEAVFRALINGRMRVFPHHLQWVRDLIGAERAAVCRSLPKMARPRIA